MKYRLTTASFTAIITALVFGLPAAAQHGGGGRGASAGHGGARGSFVAAGRGTSHPSPPLQPYFGRGRQRGWGLGPGWGWGGFVPYLGYDDYWDYPPDGYDSAAYQAPPTMPPPVVVQPPQPAREIQPLVIQREGDRWVEITGHGTPSAAPQQSAEQPSPAPSAAPEPKLPPAVLVFRDGHQEDVTSYTIIGDTLYARANHWSSAGWTKKIELSSLDVPATLKLNDERGSHFRLPSGPQEVIIRP